MGARGVAPDAAHGVGDQPIGRAVLADELAGQVFFVMGFAAFATLRGVLAVVRVNTLDQIAFYITAGGTVRLDHKPGERLPVRDGAVIANSLASADPRG